MYMHVPYTCTCTHIYVHAPPMHMYSTHTRVYIHVHAPQHVHACPIHVYMQLDYSLSVGKALPEISIACTSTTVSHQPVCLTAAQHKARSLLRLLYHCCMYIHACTASFVTFDLGIFCPTERRPIRVACALWLEQLHARTCIDVHVHVHACVHVYRRL